MTNATIRFGETDIRVTLLERPGDDPQYDIRLGVEDAQSVLFAWETAEPNRQADWVRDGDSLLVGWLDAGITVLVRLAEVEVGVGDETSPSIVLPLGGYGTASWSVVRDGTVPTKTGAVVLLNGASDERDYAVMTNADDQMWISKNDTWMVPDEIKDWLDQGAVILSEGVDIPDPIEPGV